jgi:hypothetical protein
MMICFIGRKIIQYHNTTHCSPLPKFIRDEFWQSRKIYLILNQYIANIWQIRRKRILAQKKVYKTDLSFII